MIAAPLPTLNIYAIQPERRAVCFGMAMQLKSEIMCRLIGISNYMEIL